MLKMKKDDNFLTLILLTAIFLIGGALLYTSGPRLQETSVGQLESAVLPQGGITLPIKWGDLGVQLVNAGVIDPRKLEAIYQDRGGLPEEAKTLLYEQRNVPVKMTPENANTLLNIFWAFGLANKNPILEDGPMMSYGDPSNFASTGGWTLAMGDAMNHYSKHSLVALNAEQQKLVERVSQNIYRPCCNNPTYFPDCNHGMAMLGLLEMMAANGVSEEEMYKVAL
ncbi:MAG: hypothetical protein HYW00_02080, partial [Candidatus Colwellbacteria bacterium]|nr:hypothetical protein [Candidatus Colwellbacteria bacterium]